jgi:hypothetical protein
MNTLRAILLVVAAALLAVPAVGQEPAVEVFFYPHLLTVDDRLQDGRDREAFALDGDTFLMWVDLGPGLFYTHPTAYVLISRHGVRVEPGGWWPVLNGRAILYGRQNHSAIVSPRRIIDYAGHAIEVHVCPEELVARDLLADGEDTIMEIATDTLLVWIDLEPTAFFVHPTRYVLITADGDIDVLDGQWWPTVNGKPVLFSDDGDSAVPSPFRLMGLRYGGEGQGMRRSRGRVGG